MKKGDLRQFVASPEPELASWNTRWGGKHCILVEETQYGDWPAWNVLIDGKFDFFSVEVLEEWTVEVKGGEHAEAR